MESHEEVEIVITVTGRSGRVETLTIPRATHREYEVLHESGEEFETLPMYRLFNPDRPTGMNFSFKFLSDEETGSYGTYTVKEN